MSIEFERYRIDRIGRDRALAALLAAAEHFKLVEFGKREFNAGHFGCSATVVQRQFGSWKAGMVALRLELEKFGKTLSSHSRAFISDEELFAEMERIWLLAGQRPSRYQWEQNSPRHSYGTYKHRFGGWQQACLAFIERRMGGPIESQKNNVPKGASPSVSAVKKSTVRKTIPDRLRLRVLDSRWVQVLSVWSDPRKRARSAVTPRSC